MAVAVVFDTNILFSAAGWKGPPYRCVELARSGRIQAIACWETLSELTEKLSLKLHFSEEQINDTLADLLSFHRLVPVAGSVSICRDVDDNIILENAVAGGAEFIITGDEDLLILKIYQGVVILKAADFWNRWNSGAIF